MLPSANQNTRDIPGDLLAQSLDLIISDERMLKINN